MLSGYIASLLVNNIKKRIKIALEEIEINGVVNTFYHDLNQSFYRY